MDKPIDIAIRIVAGDKRGCVAKAARAFGVSAPYLWKMKKQNHVPVEQVRAIESAVAEAISTGNAQYDAVITAEDLRPDIFCPPNEKAA